MRPNKNHDPYTNKDPGIPHPFSLLILHNNGLLICGATRTFTGIRIFLALISGATLFTARAKEPHKHTNSHRYCDVPSD